MDATNPASQTLTTYQPLYSQVKNLLVTRIGSGAWKPGEMLPSEAELAAEYKVSPGTVRKALIALEADRLIVRRQGRGTSVARHSRQETLFHFFRVVGRDDRRVIPSSLVLGQRKQRANRECARRLEVEPGSMLHAIVRLRRLEGSPAIFERVFVPVSLMPDLSVKVGSELEEEMYVIYQEQFGISIARATERLSAIPANDEEAEYLEVAPGSPLLEITRVAHDVSGRKVELRISCCRTDQWQYAAEVH